MDAKLHGLLAELLGNQYAEIVPLVVRTSAALNRPRLRNPKSSQFSEIIGRFYSPSGIPGWSASDEASSKQR
jgi:hypothetical protein